MPRQQQMSLTPLQTMVDESINFMRENEPPEGYSLADSFGKDSTVILELARMAGLRFLHIHNFTGIDPPELIKFGKNTRQDVRIIKPKFSMWHGIRTIGPPSIQRRWCCGHLKHGQTKPDIPPYRLLGIRAEESGKRSSRKRIVTISKKWTMVKPIFNWSEWHVWEFINGMGLPYCHLYDEGFARLGCVVCPMITSSSMKNVNLHRKRWPGYYKAFESATTHWFWHMAWWDRFIYKQPKNFINAWYRSFK